MHSFIPSVIFILSSVVCRISTEQIHHVKPVNSSSQNCPGQPCLTLDQYTQQTATYFTTGSTFLLLPGNHISTTAINLANISNITLKQRESDYPIKVNIAYSSEVCIVCQNVTDLKIEGLRFKLYSSNTNKSSAIKLYASNGVTLSNSTFIGSGDLSKNLVRAIYLVHSSITVENCIFERNTADNGGAMHMSGGSHVTLIGSAFISNRAHDSGGAMFACGSSLTLKETMGNIFTYNSAQFNGGAIVCINTTISIESDNITFANHSSLIHMEDLAPSTTYFSKNGAKLGGAVFLNASEASLNGTFISFKENTAVSGGGIYLSIGNHTCLVSYTKHLYFIGNRVVMSGGAIYADTDSLVNLGQTLNNSNNFLFNSGSESGGAIRNGILEITGKNYFANNHLSKGVGGAIKILLGILLVSGRTVFHNNEARLGGAVDLTDCYVTLSGRIEFTNNSAEEGGGIHCVYSRLIINTIQLDFVGNTAQSRGGAICINSIDDTFLMAGKSKFSNNLAKECGGAIFLEAVQQVTFNKISIMGNSESALCILHSTATFIEEASFCNNYGRFGGAIRSVNSKVSFHNGSVFHSNAGYIGGAVNFLYGEMKTQCHRSHITELTKMVEQSMHWVQR